MTTNTHLHSTPTTNPSNGKWHHGRTRRVAAAVVIALSAWVGIHVSGGGAAAPGPAAVTTSQTGTTVHPQATTDWLASANR